MEFETMANYYYSSTLLSTASSSIALQNGMTILIAESEMGFVLVRAFVHPK